MTGHSMKRSKALIVFVKAPENGRVKTRLQKQIGANFALKLYRGMVQDLLNNLAVTSTCFCFTPLPIKSDC